LLHLLSNLNAKCSGKFIKILGMCVCIGLIEVILMALIPSLISGAFDSGKVNLNIFYISTYWSAIFLMLCYISRAFFKMGIFYVLNSYRTKLFELYLKKFYSQTTKNLRSANFDKVEANAVHKVDQIVSSFLLPIANIIESASILTLLISYFIYKYPDSSFVIIVPFIVVLGIISSLLKAPIKLIGQKVSQLINERGMQLSLIRNNFEIFDRPRNSIIDKTGIINTVHLLSKNASYIQFVPVVSRMAIELSILCSIVGLFFFKDGNDPSFWITFVFFLFRSATPFSLLTSSVNQLEFGMKILTDYNKDLEDIRKNNESRCSFKHDTLDEDAVKNYLMNFFQEKTVLIGIIGPSGSGKSTFLSCMSGTSGYQTDSHLEGTTWSYLPQNGMHFLPTVRQQLDFFDVTLNEELIDKYFFIIEDFVKRDELFDFDLGIDASKLSGGQRQRLGIFVFLLRDSDVYFLDEPLSALDENTSKSLVKRLSLMDGKKLFFIIYHNRSIDEYFDNKLNIQLNKDGSWDVCAVE
jgi:ABC-type transport system involved in cytochrome bd biosynthesis fused ATPase/permease subunit